MHVISSEQVAKSEYDSIITYSNIGGEKHLIVRTTIEKGIPTSKFIVMQGYEQKANTVNLAKALDVYNNLNNTGLQGISPCSQ